MAELGKILSPMVFPVGNAAVAMSKDTKEKVEKVKIFIITQGFFLSLMYCNFLTAKMKKLIKYKMFV